MYLPSHCQVNNLKEWFLVYVPSDSWLFWRGLCDCVHILLSFWINKFSWKLFAICQHADTGLLTACDGCTAVFFATVVHFSALVLWFWQFFCIEELLASTMSSVVPRVHRREVDVWMYFMNSGREKARCLRKVISSFYVLQLSTIQGHLNSKTVSWAVSFSVT